ncbi:MAG: hypothetical protein EA381_16415 [Planctomycetaceae bacterium]|nr:MAG: hypothetical protein EA381_16415 [Planctomycetaceae bacterium]
MKWDVLIRHGACAADCTAERGASPAFSGCRGNEFGLAGNRGFRSLVMAVRTLPAPDRCVALRALSFFS